MSDFGTGRYAALVPAVAVAKRFKFSAAHRLPSDPGPCHRVHGHTYEVEVIASGELNGSGMVVHFDEIKEAWSEIERNLDHSYLNDSLPPEAQPPTTENVALWLLAELRQAIPEIAAVRLWEGPSSYAFVEAE